MFYTLGFKNNSHMNVTWLSFFPSIMIENLAICNNWIYWFNLINPIPWFEWISLILWSDLIIPIPWFNLLALNQLLFSSTTRGRWWKMLPTTFRKIWLIRPRTQIKYMRTVYTYITSSGYYVNSAYSQSII